MRQKQRAEFSLLHTRQSQFRFYKAEPGIVFEENFNLVLILLHIDCTGRIHQTAVFGKSIRTILQDFLLNGAQIFHAFQIFIPDIRLFGNDPQTGTGHIAQDPIEGAQLFLRNSSIVMNSTRAADAAALKRFFDQTNSSGDHFSTDESAFVLHLLRECQAFASRSCTEVQDFLPRPYCQGKSCELTGQSLHMVLALCKGLSRCRRALKIHHQCMGPRSGMHGVPFRPKFLCQGLIISAQRIDAYC